MEEFCCPGEFEAVIQSGFVKCATSMESVSSIHEWVLEKTEKQTDVTILCGDSG